ncbi:MAG: VCBS repeat-containing protein [Lacipirellulaceae bacterium]
MKKATNNATASTAKPKVILLTLVFLLVVAAIAAVPILNRMNRQQAMRQMKEDLNSKLDAVGSSQRESESTVRGIVSSEELILELTPKIRPLARSLFNLQLPDDSADALFSDQVEIVGRLESPAKDKALPNGLVTRTWNLSTDKERSSRENLTLWNRLFERAKYLENGKFYFIKGAFAEGKPDEFHAVVGSSGLVQYRDDRRSSWSAKLKLIWTRNDSLKEESRWQISSWKTDSFKTIESESPLFADVLSPALPEDSSYERATFSQHEKMTSDLLQGKQIDRSEGDNYPFFFAEVTLEHPGVAVVDIDQDGLDDAFIAMQHGQNLLFRNRGDGTFEEVAAEYGLDATGNSSSAIFADFDNDGDPDLFLGRPRHRGQYYVNDQGSFVEGSSELIATDLPYMISSISAADYNGDGLLDVYLSTYSPLENMHQFMKSGLPIWAKQYLSGSEIEEFKRRISKTHLYLGRPGPPNMLLTNVGDGKFELAKENDQIQLWRKSFQATWSDFDSDGDPDLYVSNDYGPDNFLRNDGSKGFTDITQEAGLDAMGFGMGVSWGDYDNNGQFDLYVSNMFSKAGQRITSRVDGIDSRFRDMAAGNFLYRYEDQKFKRVSGPEKTDLQVEKAGWSWGGQFLDFNNDGYQDIYAASGFYTAPADIAVDMDL